MHHTLCTIPCAPHPVHLWISCHLDQRIKWISIQIGSADPNAISKHLVEPGSPKKYYRDNKETDSMMGDAADCAEEDVREFYVPQPKQ